MGRAWGNHADRARAPKSGLRRTTPSAPRLGLSNPVHLVALQRTAGNRAVTAALQRRKAGESPPPPAPSGVSVRLGGAEVAKAAVVSTAVERDLDEVDVCTVVLRNTPPYAFARQIKHGAELTVNFGGGTNEFSGEVVGVEPGFKGGGGSTVQVRAFSLLNRLARGAKSHVFTDVTDRDIVKEISARAKLTPVYDALSLKHRTVYQHNQTDLEFLRVRAGRLGARIWCEGSTLYFMSASTAADPKQKIDLGQGARGSFRAQVTPIDEKDQVIVGEATIQGRADLKPGMTVTLVTQEPRLDGDYIVIGVSHRSGAGAGGPGGFTTTLKVRRGNWR